MNQKSKNPLHFSNHARNAKYKEIWTFFIPMQLQAHEYSHFHSFLS
jgi:hypothetical protein